MPWQMWKGKMEWFPDPDPKAMNPPGIQGYQFGNTPVNIAPGGLVSPTDAASTGKAMANAVGRNAPNIAGVDFSGMGNTQASQIGLLNQMQGYAAGLGPSAANIGNSLAMGQAAGAGRAGISGGSPLASRQGLGAMAGGMSSAYQQGAAARAAEQGQAFGALGGAAQGLAGQNLAAGSLANQQIEQQQALGLGQAQRNYGLAQGTLGTSLQEQLDSLNFAQHMKAIAQQRQNAIINSELKAGASVTSAVGTGFTGGGG